MLQVYGIPTIKCKLSNVADLWNPYNKVQVKQLLFIIIIYSLFIVDSFTIEHIHI